MTTVRPGNKTASTQTLTPEMFDVELQTSSNEHQTEPVKPNVVANEYEIKLSEQESSLQELLNNAQPAPHIVAHVREILSDKEKSDAFLNVPNPHMLPPESTSSWYVPVQIGEHLFHFLLDTGSFVTILSRRSYRKINAACKTSIVKTNIALKSASGDRIPMDGVCVAEFEIGGKPILAKAIVAKIDCAGIIGSNFLEYYDCKMAMSSGLLQTPHGTVYMAKGRKPLVCQVRTSADVKIPGNSQVVLWCHVKQPSQMTSAVGIIDPLGRVSDRYGVLVGRSLVSTGKLVPVLILNPSKAPAEIPKGGKIALLKSVGYVQNSEKVFEEARVCDVVSLGSGSAKSATTFQEPVGSQTDPKSLSLSDPGPALSSGLELDHGNHNKTRYHRTWSLDYPFSTGLGEAPPPGPPSDSESQGSLSVQTSGSTYEVNAESDEPLISKDAPNISVIGLPVCSRLFADTATDNYRQSARTEKDTRLPELNIDNTSAESSLSDFETESDLPSPDWSESDHEESHLLDPISSEAEVWMRNIQSEWKHSSGETIVLPEHLKCLIPEELSPEEQYTLATTVKHYEDVFTGADGRLGRTGLVKHEIVTNEKRPIKQPVRRLGPAKDQIVDQELDKMLKAGVIEPSDSPWSSPVVLVKKKDGSIRFCVDYRQLNNVTRKDAYPLPNIEDALSVLAGAKYFCTLDLASGYWQVELSEDAKQKSAFCTRKGLYQFNVMPFGLSNAPATFERLMELCLKGLCWRQCVVYIDDIIVFGKTFHDCHARLENVFSRLRSTNLKLKPKKCHLFKPSTIYLGNKISEDGIEPDPTKVEAARTWSPPCTLKGVRSFLGFASYHRRFIPKFADVAEPLNILNRKGQPFIWGEAQQNSFEKLRTALMSAPVLSHPLPQGEYLLDTDASLSAIGGALYQLQDGEERLISYASRTLSPTQRNYCTTKRELLAVVHMVHHYRHYLWGRPFRIRTDHASLRWLLNFKAAEGMLARWIVKLAEYDFKIEYREGKSHSNADGLSRRRCHGCPRMDCPDKQQPDDPLTSSDDENMFPESNEYAYGISQPVGPSCVTYNMPVESPNLGTKNKSKDPSCDDEWFQGYSPEELSTLQMNDPDIARVWQWRQTSSERPDSSISVMESAEVQGLLAQWNRLIIQNQILYRIPTTCNLDDHSHLQYVVPRAYRLDIMHLVHDIRLSGHLGIEKTQKRISNRFFWPRMYEDVRRWVTSCPACQRRKGAAHPNRSPLAKMLVGAPFRRIGIDVLDTRHRSNRGNRVIIVIVDYFTKWTIAVARSNHTAATCADVIMKHFVCQFGVPHEMVSDQGPEFESKLFQGLCDLLRIHKVRTSPYRPQTDGLVERANRSIIDSISKFVNSKITDWDEHLPYLVMALNTSAHSSTGVSPFAMVYGVEANLPVDLVFPPPEHLSGHFTSGSEYIEFLRNSMADVHQYAREQLRKSALRQQRSYDAKAKTKPAFKIGDLVRYFYPPLRVANKFANQWIGPYTIISKETDVNYRIKGMLQSGREDIRVVHMDNLIHFEVDRNLLFEKYTHLQKLPPDYFSVLSRCSKAPDDVKQQIRDPLLPDFNKSLAGNETDSLLHDMRSPMIKSPKLMSKHDSVKSPSESINIRRRPVRKKTKPERFK